MAAKKRIGRPPKSEEDRKGVNFTFRNRGQMRERLQEAAAASKRSISEEIEHRLEDSFRNEDIYGGPHLSAVFRLLASHKALAEAKAGESWTESDFVQTKSPRRSLD
jgi:Arc-like DNA binding domain